MAIEKKDKFVSTAVTESEKELIEKAGEIKGLRQSEYIRMTMIKDAEKVIRQNKVKG